jgi:hypothetical protein
MRNTTWSAIVIAAFLTLLVGCATWVAPQKVPVPVTMPDGSIGTNYVEVESLTPDKLAALQSSTSLLPPPWDSIGLAALTLGSFAYTEYRVRKVQPPSVPPAS